MQQENQDKQIWDEPHPFKPLEDPEDLAGAEDLQGLEHHADAELADAELADGEEAADDWEPRFDQDLPSIHDERLGAKTFVPNVALELYEMAAKQGDAQAQYNLGLCYHYGEGTLKDPNNAFKWFSESAKEGHAEAQYSLGIYYQLGIGARPDLVNAFKWFEQAAIQNQAKAQHELGVSYYYGRGVTKNLAMAKKWINKSYINGNKQASESWEKYQLWKY